MNFSLTTFDKSGKLNQIEYALNRVAQGKMSLGIKAKNGVVIATDKKVQVRLRRPHVYARLSMCLISANTVSASLPYLS